MTNLILPRRRELITAAAAAGLAAASPALGHNGGPPITDGEVRAAISDVHRAGVELPWGSQPSDRTLAMFMMAKMAGLMVGDSAAAGVVTTWNPLDKTSGVTLSNLNLTAYVAAIAERHEARATVGYSIGKRYFEILVVDNGNDSEIGFSNLDYILGTSYVGSVDGTMSISFASSGRVYNAAGGSGNSIATGVDTQVGKRIGLCIDIGASKWWVMVNGTVISGSPALGTGGYQIYGSPPFFPALTFYGSPLATQIIANFGGSAFDYPPPAGFLAWNA